MLVVIDTNVLVSGLLSNNGSPSKIVNLIQDLKIRPVIDQRIMEEYIDVLQRPFGFNARRVEDLLNHIRLNGLLLLPSQLRDLSAADGVLDPDDLPFAEVALSSGVAALITGNTRHFAFLKEYNQPVFTPAEYLNWLKHRRGS
jgi:putative PIN family toxin of toxin-antitoxin system